MQRETENVAMGIFTVLIIICKYCFSSANWQIHYGVLPHTFLNACGPAFFLRSREVDKNRNIIFHKLLSSIMLKMFFHFVFLFVFQSYTPILAFDDAVQIEGTTLGPQFQRLTGAGE